MRQLLKICVGLLMVFAACQNADAPPVVYLPVNVAALSTNDTLAFSFTATDDEGLAEVGYTIFTNGDTIPGILPGWWHDELSSASGKTTFGGDTLPLPDSISAGDYRLTVFAADEAGFTDSVTSTFAISSKIDSLLPALDTLISPDTLDAGEPLSLQFSLSDDTRLAYVSFHLTNLANDSTLLRNDQAVSGMQYADSLQLDTLGTIQRVRFELIFHDWVNNKASESTDIIIRE